MPDARFDPVAYINEPRWRHTSLGLGRMRLLLGKLGDPQRRFRSVHVAGTNGKGSTCAYISSILRASGLRTGLFTSPYIERFEERIQVDGDAISMEELASATLAVREAAEEVAGETGEHPTEFELMCAVGFVHFARRGCDFAVVEVGLGGRLDATNVIEPELSVIARIGMDHTDVLGDTLPAIAAEKAGVVKPATPVVSWPQEPEAGAVVRARCEELGCELLVSDFRELEVERLGHAAPSGLARCFRYKGRRYETKLLAGYQPANASVAIDAARALGVPQEAVERGIADAAWPGRFEAVRESPLVVVDGAHNPQGARAFAESLEELLRVRGAGRKPTLVAGVLADKDCPGIVGPVLPLAGRLVAYTPDNPRALGADALAREVRRQAAAKGLCLQVEVAPDALHAMKSAVQKEGPDGCVAAFGTLYSIGALKQALRAPESPD